MWAKLIAKLLNAAMVIPIAIAVIGIVVAALWLFSFTERGIKVTEKGIKEADKIKRTVGGYEHKPDETLSLIQRRVRAITAGVCIDTEGETPECREDAEDVTIDAYVRLNNRFSQTSPEDITTKSYVWLPNDWEYPIHWRDRPLETIERGREACVARLKPKIEERVQKGPGAGCGDRTQRPGSHL